MADTLSSEKLLHEAALKWFHSTNTTPQRQISTEKIVALYQKTKSYAESDPLLAEFYQANHLRL